MKMSSLCVVMSAAILIACAKKEASTSDSTLKVDSANGTSAPAAMPPADTATKPVWTDANIAAMLDEANMGDSAGGKMATTKGTRSDVRAFGVLMMRDHHALRVAGLNLVKKLNLTPTPPPDDSLPAEVKVIQDSLSYLAKGAAWDKAYIDGEVNVHMKVLAVIGAAQGIATAPELKALLTKAQPNIEMHLKRAQEIQSKLVSSPTAKP